MGIAVEEVCANLKPCTFSRGGCPCWKLGDQAQVEQIASWRFIYGYVEAESLGRSCRVKNHV